MVLLLRFVSRVNEFVKKSFLRPPAQDSFVVSASSIIGMFMQKFRELILVQLLCIYAQGPYRVRKVTFPNFIYGEFKTKKRAETHKLPYYTFC